MGWVNRIAVALTLVALLGGGIAYAFEHAKPQLTADQVGGAIVIEKQLVVDLAGGRYARVTVGLEVPPKLAEAFAESGVVRDVITRDLTNLKPEELLVRERRERLKRRIARDIRSRTDVSVGRVLLTDFTIH